ncbi:MAG: hypothetical protein CMF43_02520 [Legionellales bacterium]|nr:hypothetical protein [Legionellales bacterium]
MRKMLRKIVTWLFCAIAVVASANPLRLSTTHMLIPRTGQEYITVFNTSDAIAYFRVNVERVVINAQGQPTYVTARNPNELGLLVSPVNLKMQPRQKRKVRVLSLVNKVPGLVSGTGHVYYRIDFDHVTQQDLEQQKKMNDPVPDGALQFLIRGKIAKTVIVDVGSRQDLNPQTSNQFVKVDRPDSKITQQLEITNTGNVVVWIVDMEICDASACQKGGWFRMLYPGEIYRIDVPPTTVKMSYTEKLGKRQQRQSVTIPA